MKVERTAKASLQKQRVKFPGNNGTRPAIRNPKMAEDGEKASVVAVAADGVSPIPSFLGPQPSRARSARLPRRPTIRPSFCRARAFRNTAILLSRQPLL